MNGIVTMTRIKRSEIVDALPKVDKQPGYAPVHNEAELWWTARAIWNERQTYFDVLHDRQNCSEKVKDKSDESRQFLKDVNELLKELQAAFHAQGTTQSSSDYVMVERDGVTLLGSPNGSYGYAYIGAWKE